MDERASQPVVYRYAIFVKIRKNGKTAYNRRPYDVVELDWRNGERYRYIQPRLGGVPKNSGGSATSADLQNTLVRVGTHAGVEEQECIYDDVWIYSSIPDFDICSATHSDLKAYPNAWDQPRGFNPPL